jgi:hypothetical protein
MKLFVRCICVLSMALGAPALCRAGGAWVPNPGDGDVSLGVSRKTASTSWDVSGNSYVNANGAGQVSYHDFRYGYLTGELGLFKNLSASFLLTYLDGFEGAHAVLEENQGPSDAWFGLKYAIAKGDLPMAIAFTYRTPFLYKVSGPYNRYVYDRFGHILHPSPNWRGLLKNDYTVSYLISQSVFHGGWWNAQVGYTWRDGAPADQIPVLVDLGYPLPFWSSYGKLAASYYRSLGNFSPAQPDDRFGNGAKNNFNNASILRVAVSILVPVGPKQKYWVEGGYGQWVWGLSARRYREPFISVDRRF